MAGHDPIADRPISGRTQVMFGSLTPHLVDIERSVVRRAFYLFLSLVLTGCHGQSVEASNPTERRATTLPIYQQEQPSPTGQNIPWDEFIEEYSPPPESKLRFCRDSKVPEGTRLGGIKHVLGRDELFGLGDDSECMFQIVSDPRDLSLSSQAQFEECYVAFRADDGIVLHLQFAVPNPTELALQKCNLRIGLWATGRSEYARIPGKELFIPLSETRWWGLPGMPDLIPNVPLDD